MTANRTRLLFVALVVAQLVFVAGRARDPHGAANLLEGAFLRALAPLARLVDASGDALSGARAAARSREALEQENERLRAEVVELRRERLRWTGLELESEELARGAGFVAERRGEMHGARIVYFDARSAVGSLVLDVGARGARIDQPVVAEAGLVGRVVATAGRWAKVQLITDRAASAGVVLEAARRQGVLRGGGPGRLEIDYVPRQTTVEPGDRVTTAGIDGVYPRGLAIGVVATVERGDEMFHRITVTPAVELADLAMVYLLDRAAPPAELAEGSVRAGR